MNFLRQISILGAFSILALAVAISAGCAPKQAPDAATDDVASVASEPVEDVPAQVTKGGDIALALPLSGPYSPIAQKILAGARAAVANLAEQGVSVSLAEIDTYASDWVQRLQALPPSFKVVGGPLRPNAFSDVENAGLNKERVFFTFLQGMGTSLEGRDAWRFFSSPDDQIRTLLQVARRDFGIVHVGVLYPNEPFGKRIAQLFIDGAEQEGVEVNAVQAYPPEDPLRWSEIVAELLYKGDGEAIQAVFLPDVWSKAEMLVPFFFYHQREDLLLMGSTLWGQTLNENINVDLHNFRLSLFPAVWWPQSNTPAARELPLLIPEMGTPEFWHVLGYDFIRFASGLNAIPENWTPLEVNTIIQSAQKMNWSMAPITWRADGVAKQDMFLFTPAKSGMQPADLPAMRQRQQAVKARMTN